LVGESDLSLAGKRRHDGKLSDLNPIMGKFSFRRTCLQKPQAEFHLRIADDMLAFVDLTASTTAPQAFNLE
jgi:hypothetical protein